MLLREASREDSILQPQEAARILCFHVVYTRASVIDDLLDAAPFWSALTRPAQATGDVSVGIGRLSTMSGSLDCIHASILHALAFRRRSIVHCERDNRVAQLP